MTFPTQLADIEKRIAEIQPAKYAATRNYSNGAVTRLSPYISRGVISTKYVFEKLLDTRIPFAQMEKLVQELAWRDYWQQIWIAKGDAIHQDLKHQQHPVRAHGMPEAVLNASTGIEAVDEAIRSLYKTGYMHNHMRMYVASIACNIAQCHWAVPAKWMYSYLLDGDWASNALSWQWVAGANANKKYYANQENINKYFSSRQEGTFLDVSYDQFANMEVPEVLQAVTELTVKTKLPDNTALTIDYQKPCLIYNYYNMDPYWHEGEDANRILFFDTEFFQQYPVQQSNINFVLGLADNIPGMQVFTGTFNDLYTQLQDCTIFYKEHPTNSHYIGHEEPRDWMFGVKGYYPSFFAFWKKCRKEIATQFNQ